MATSTDRADKRKLLGSLKQLARGFYVESLADGTIKVIPKWRKGYGGVMSRLALAARIEDVLTRELHDGH